MQLSKSVNGLRFRFRWILTATKTGVLFLQLALVGRVSSHWIRWVCHKKTMDFNRDMPKATQNRGNKWTVHKLRCKLHVRLTSIHRNSFAHICLCLNVCALHWVQMKERIYIQRCGECVIHYDVMCVISISNILFHISNPVEWSRVCKTAVHVIIFAVQVITFRCNIGTMICLCKLLIVWYHGHTQHTPFFFLIN